MGSPAADRLRNVPARKEKFSNLYIKIKKKTAKEPNEHSQFVENQDAESGMRLQKAPEILRRRGNFLLTG